MSVAIPAEWRRTLKKNVVSRNAIFNGEEPCIRFKNKKPVSLIINKDIYSLFLKQVKTEPKCISRWAEYFPDYNFCWQEIFKLPFETVRCTMLQSLQYRILHRIYPCNYWVAKWEQDTQPVCSHCEEIDTLDHHFFYCVRINNLWKFFNTWWSNNIEKVDLSVTDILFGYMKKSHWGKALNYSILHGKLFISKIVNSNYDPVSYSFLVQLKNALILEKCISVKNDQLDIFNTNFGILYEAIG